MSYSEDDFDTFFHTLRKLKLLFFDKNILAQLISTKNVFRRQRYIISIKKKWKQQLQYSTSSILSHTSTILTIYDAINHTFTVLSLDHISYAYSIIKMSNKLLKILSNKNFDFNHRSCKYLKYEDRVIQMEKQ